MGIKPPFLCSEEHYYVIILVFMLRSVVEREKVRPKVRPCVQEKRLNGKVIKNEK